MRWIYLFETEEFIMAVLAAIMVTGLIATVEPEEFHAGYLWLLVVLPIIGYILAVYRHRVKE